MQRARTSILVIAALGLALGGCASDDARRQVDETASGYEHVFAAIRGLHGKQRTAKLVALAKQEGGELSLYTSVSGDAAAAFAEGFEDAYGLGVAVYRADTESVYARLTEEAQANFHGADVSALDGLALFNLNRKSLLVHYRPDGLSLLVPDAGRDGWTVSEFATFVVSWNTNLVGAGERPRSWEDLAAPKWRGKLAMEVGDFEWYGTLRDHWVSVEGKSEAEADRLFAQMGRNALVLRGHTLMAQLLAAGEFEVAASTFANGIDELRKEGAHIARVPPVEPVIVRTNGVGLVRNARHPAAAVLYLEWLIGDGQETAVELGREPARRDLATGSRVRSVWEDYAKLVAHQDEWRAGYERILRKGKELPDDG